MTDTPPMSKPPLAVPKQTPENTFCDHVSPSVQARKSRLLTLTLCGAGLDPDTRRTGDIRLRGWGFTAEKVASNSASNKTLTLFTGAESNT